MIGRFLTWLRSHWYGSDQIAVELEGEEVIHLDEWGALPPEERDQWEPTDTSDLLYRRKQW
jgi:hypothetical protein